MKQGRIGGAGRQGVKKKKKTGGVGGWGGRGTRRRNEEAKGKRREGEEDVRGQSSSHPATQLCRKPLRKKKIYTEVRKIKGRCDNLTLARNNPK